MTKTKAFDFGSRDFAAACDKPFKLEFADPVSNEPVGCGVMVLGKDSAAFKEHVRSKANERLRRNAMQGRKGKDAEVPTIERIEAEAIDLLVACTTGFWGDLVVDGAALSYSPDNARALYARFTWAREQVDEAIGDVENFIRA